jgi:tetratricopeptide (TPR) repeat protein
MAFPIIPAIAIGVGGVALYRAKRKGKMTAERKKIFEAALKTQKDPNALEKLAVAYEKEGLKAEAIELRKRAKNLTLSPEKKQQYRTIYKQALSNEDPNKVKTVAEAFYKQGFYGSAKNLRDYAEGLISRVVKT